jgi:trk system potassium uptake protein TrkH
MLLFGVNFNLYFLLLIRRWREVLKNEELHWYVSLIFIAALLLAVGASPSCGGFLPALHQGFFNVAAILSTTGFGTVDFTLWPEWCKWILILLMFCGGCAGSTGGGMKLSRLMILDKTVAAELKQMIRPRSVQRIEMDGQRVEGDTIRAAAIFAASSRRRRKHSVHRRPPSGSASRPRTRA